MASKQYTPPSQTAKSAIVVLAPVALGEGTTSNPDLPPPEREPWRAVEVRLPKGDINRLASAGIVKAVEREQTTDGRRMRYQTDPEAWAILQDRWSRVLPCGHGGFTNPRDTDGYGCGCEDCHRVYTREQIREVFGSGE